MSKTKPGITAVLFIALLLITSALSAFAGGTGTQTDPYQITSAAELNSVRNYMGATNAGKYFKLLNDIDLTAYLTTGGEGFTAWGAAGWLPIGSSGSPFCGHFDGDNHKITGLKIDRSGYYECAFWSYTQTGSTIENLKIETAIGSFVFGYRRNGVLVGTNFGALKNCSASGNVKGGTWSGMLVGWNEGTISNCTSSGYVAGTDNSIGGLVGQNNGAISNSYSRADVSGVHYIGGLVGCLYGFIANSYSTGYLTGGQIGGLCGYSSGTVNNSFWDKQTSGIATSYGGTGKTTAEMKMQFTFTGWDFMEEPSDGSNDYWGINPGANNSYPFLQWQGYPHVGTEFATGTGTDTDPFLITTAAHLNHIRNYLGDTNASKHFKLNNDIDLTTFLAPGGAGYLEWGVSGWNPIGGSATPFSGHFDGNNHKITGLKINSPGVYECAFWSYTQTNSIIENLRIETAVDGFVLGYQRNGIIAGTNKGFIRNCSASGSVKGGLWSGMLVGWNDGYVTGCSSSGDITGTDNTIGGLVGQNNAIISDSYSRAKVSGSNYIGGLVGYHGAGTIINCYALGFVTGGIKGGLCGAQVGAIGSSYWDIQTTGMTTSFGGVGKTTAEMKTQSTFTDWDFTTAPIWHLSTDNYGYPHLAWQNFTAAVPEIPVATAATGITTTVFKANWQSSWGANGYFLDVATNTDFTVFVNGYNNLNVGTAITKELTGLTPNTLYYYRVRAVNATGTSTNSNTITVQTKAPDQLPPEVTAITGTSAFLETAMLVTATITDETGIALVEGFYQLTGQTAWTPFTMTQVGTTSTYTGIIPAQNGVVTGKVKFKTTDTMMPTANSGESQEYNIAWTDEMVIGWGSMNSNTGQGQNTNPIWKLGMDYDFGSRMDLVLKRIEFAYMNLVSGLTTLDVPWSIQKVTQTNASTITETGVLGTLSGTANTAVTSGSSTIIINNNNTLTGHIAATLILPTGFYVKVDVNGTNGHRYGTADVLSTAMTLFQLDDGTNHSWCARMIVGPKGSGVDEFELLPGKSELAQNYPNPFNPTTTINFYNNMSGNVKLTVMNAKGEVVSKLVDCRLSAGNHNYNFDGNGLNSGVYFYKLETPNGSLVKKMIMVK